MKSLSTYPNVLKFIILLNLMIVVVYLMNRHDIIYIKNRSPKTKDTNGDSNEHDVCCDNWGWNKEMVIVKVIPENQTRTFRRKGVFHNGNDEKIGTGGTVELFLTPPRIAIWTYALGRSLAEGRVFRLFYIL